LDTDAPDSPPLAEVLAVQRERAKTLLELAASSRYFYEDFEEFDAKAAKKHLRPVIMPAFESLHQALQDLSDWQANNISDTIQQVAEKHGLKMPKLGQPLRVAVTGSGASPSIELTLVLIGKARCLHRMAKALQFMQIRAAASS